MHLILLFLMIFIAVSSIISMPPINQRTSFSRKGGYQDKLYYSPHMQEEKNCDKQTNVISLDLLSQNKDGLITIVYPILTDDNIDQQDKLCQKSAEDKTIDQYSKIQMSNIEAAGFQLIKNGNFQFDRLPQFRFNQSFATNWIFNQSLVVQGSRLFPKWASQVALLGIQCLSLIESCPQNKPYSIIQQSFELKQSSSIVIGFNFGLITFKNAFKKLPIQKTRLIWAHFNGQLAFSSQVTQFMSSASLSMIGKKGKNILTFKSIRADFDCDGSEMIALDNVTAMKV